MFYLRAGRVPRGNRRVHGMGASVGAARYHQAGHSNDEACPRERGSLAARQRQKDHDRFSAIVSLSAFERFVFVMSILERMSDGDCLNLLRCSRRELDLARELAVRFLATTDSGTDYLHQALDAWGMFLSSPQL